MALFWMKEGFQEKQDRKLLHQVLNEPSDANSFWRKTLAMEREILRIRRFGSRIGMLFRLRKEQKKTKQFEHAATSRSCMKSIARHKR